MVALTNTTFVVNQPLHEVLKRLGKQVEIVRRIVENERVIERGKVMATTERIIPFGMGKAVVMLRLGDATVVTTHFVSVSNSCVVRLPAAYKAKLNRAVENAPRKAVVG